MSESKMACLLVWKGLLGRLGGGTSPLANDEVECGKIACTNIYTRIPIHTEVFDRVARVAVCNIFNKFVDTSMLTLRCTQEADARRMHDAAKHTTDWICSVLTSMLCTDRIRILLCRIGLLFASSLLIWGTPAKIW